MILYAVILLGCAVLFLVLGISIRKGNTKLIHDYHQTRVRPEDKAAYGKAFSKGMFCLSGTMAVSGIISLLGQSKKIVTASVAVLYAGIAVALVFIIRAQKKYNGGIF